MKKEYIKPEMQVYEVETQKLLTDSLKLGDEPEDGNDDII